MKKHIIIFKLKGGDEMLLSLSENNPLYEIFKNIDASKRGYEGYSSNLNKYY